MVNVRLRLCDLFPSLKVIILLPPDRELQQMFEAAIATLLTDRDSECQLAMQKSVKQMGSINYRIQSVSAHVYIMYCTFVCDLTIFDKKGPFKS